MSKQTHATLDEYIRSRASALGMSVSEVCSKAGISRQSFYALAQIPDKLPELKTIIALAHVLQVHPLRLLHLVFDKVPVHSAARAKARGDRSAFVADVTFPDGAVVLPGQAFTKVWKMHNVGTVAWENRFLQCMDEEIVVTSRTGEVLTLGQNLRPHAQRVAVPLTLPGQTVQVSVDFTAPAQAMTVLSYWKSVFEDGRLCFPNATGVWCKVQVTAMSAAGEGGF